MTNNDTSTSESERNSSFHVPNPPVRLVLSDDEALALWNLLASADESLTGMGVNHASIRDKLTRQIAEVDE